MGNLYYVKITDCWGNTQKTVLHEVEIADIKELGWEVKILKKLS